VQASSIADVRAAKACSNAVSAMNNFRCREAAA